MKHEISPSVSFFPDFISRVRRPEKDHFGLQKTKILDKEKEMMKMPMPMNICELETYSIFLTFTL